MATTTLVCCRRFSTGKLMVQYRIGYNPIAGHLTALCSYTVIVLQLQFLNDYIELYIYFQYKHTVDLHVKLYLRVECGLGRLFFTSYWVCTYVCVDLRLISRRV